MSALLRIELRELLRNRQRTLLILILIALPVAAVAGGSTLAVITEITGAERVLRSMGTADLHVAGTLDYETRKRALSRLPEGATATTFFEGSEEVRVPGVRLRARAVALEPQTLEAGALASGMLQMVSGRPPEFSDEVALSPSLLQALGVVLGDSVTLDFGTERTITGTVIDPEDTQAALILRIPAAVEYRGQHALLIGLGGADPAPLHKTLRDAGLEVTAREEVGPGNQDMAHAIVALSVLGFLQAGMVIAAAFAVGLKRRQFELGLLRAAGAPPRSIRRALFLATLLVALVSSLLGVGLGLLGALAVHPFLDGLNGRINGPFETSFPHLLAAVALGVLSALLAVVAPARSITKTTVRDALTKRRASGGRSAQRSTTRGLMLGVALTLAGACLLLLLPKQTVLTRTLSVLGGPILGLLGAAWMSPFLLDVFARKASRLPLVWRLAVRDGGRFRSRNGPVVVAVLAGMSMCVTMAVFVASFDRVLDELPGQLRSDQVRFLGPGAEQAAGAFAQEVSAANQDGKPAVVAPLQSVWSGNEPVRARFGEHPPGPRQLEWLATGDLALLDALGAGEHQAAFLAGKVLAFQSSESLLVPASNTSQAPKADQALRFETWLSKNLIAKEPQGTQPGDTEPGNTPAITVARVEPSEAVIEPLFLIHQNQLARLGLEARPPMQETLTPFVVRLPQPVSAEQRTIAQQMAGEHWGTTVRTKATSKPPLRKLFVLVLGICLLVGTTIVLIATALSSSEAARDQQVLHVVGAPPRLLRRFKAARAAYLALLGCVLALMAGLMPAKGLLSVVNFGVPFTVPVIEFAAILMGLPLLTWLASYGLPKRLAKKGAAFAVLFLTLALPLRAAQWQPHTGKAFDGSPLAGEITWVEVPEAEGSKTTIELAVVRYRTRHSHPGPPIMYLAGGPGGSGTEHVGTLATHPQIRLLEHRDVLAIDQRGTGRSKPAVNNEPLSTFEVPWRQGLERETVIEAVRRLGRENDRYWRARGVDLLTYNTEQSAHDLERVRSALGLDQIALYAASYGTHLALAYLRHYDRFVERAVLLKVEGPNHTWKLPSTTQRHLEALADQFRADSTAATTLPSPLETIRSLLAELERGVTVLYQGRPMRLTAYDLQLALAQALSRVEDWSEIPAQLAAFERGEWQALAEASAGNRMLEVPAMTQFMDCASGASEERLAQIRREQEDAALLLQDSQAYPFYPEACAGLAAGITPDLGGMFRRPVETHVPLLLVSGEADVRTPPENVGELARFLPGAVQVLVSHSGHSSRELMSREFRDLLQAFLRGDSLEARYRIDLPPLLLVGRSR